MNENLLTQLDPASPPSPELSARAKADLERILASDAPAPVSLESRRSRGRIAAGLAVAASVAMAGVLAPSALRTGDTAFASWTPTAGPLVGDARDDAADSCRDSLGDADPMATEATIAVAERRGDWATVLLSGEGGYSGLCITDASTGWFRTSMIGSSGVATGLDPVGARGVVATDLGSGTMSSGDISMAAGQVGPEVTGIAMVTSSHGIVTATVANGRFALWFPGGELGRRAADGGVVPVQVTYQDGSTGSVDLHL